MSDPLSATEAVKPLPSADRYASLLDEARALRGVSLWQDAWRRLRKNWAAMGSLAFLVMMLLLAALTPLLPLQSTIVQDLENRQYQEPSFASVDLKLVEPLREYDEQVRQLQAQPASDFAAPASNAKAADAKAADAKPSDAKAADKEEPETPSPEALKAEKLAQLYSKNPIRKLWHNPGWLTRQMIRARLMVFGDYCIPSLCGCDSLGRDLLARICWGARVSLMVGLVAALVSLIIGVSYGATAGYAGGWIDDAMMRAVDVMYSVPFIFVVIFIITILDAEEVAKALDRWGIDQMVIFFILIGAIYWLTMARVVRGQVISLKTEQFIEAARTIGAGSGRIVMRHLVPNLLGVVIVYLTLTIPAVMLFEAFLSFLGLGVEPPDVSWGLLVNEGVSVITPVETYWWLVLYPGLTLTLTLFSLNFLGDGLRDALDPRLKNRE
ncbi:ABC transporter permease [Lignipirellula cremea]|uniref:Oligopeptide transport system permease protein OppC n=1 Tax=Lignipirellula cremea TaxID=2528010 RepID=A0A518DYH9_9BACT|nr:ABC transporter permease [Lignipirellula cremea]QDU96897.1 Oligopeptide transport system permease protein OppC [Lignipirellula cremea]